MHDLFIDDQFAGFNTSICGCVLIQMNFVTNITTEDIILNFDCEKDFNSPLILNLLFCID